MAAPPSIHDRSRPWADLPVPMVDTVVQHLDVFSATRLAAVCKSWETAVATDPTLPFRNDTPPCLLRTREFDDDGFYDYGDTFDLMDFSRDSCEASLPAHVWGVHGQRWVGGKDDWLATVDDCGDARLVNPYAGIQIDLPDIDTLVPAGAKNRDTFRRIIVCETPIDAAGTGYLVLAVVSTHVLAIAGGGDESWTALRNPAGYSGFSCSDAVLHKGKVFAVDRSGSVYAWDVRADACFELSDAEPELTEPPDVDDLLDELECRWRLAESADGGRLLLVCLYGKEVVCQETGGYRHRVFTYTGFYNEGVRLYERDVEAATGDDDDGWSAVVSLGDHSLFLGVNYPISARIDKMDPSRSTYPSLLRPNCICVTDYQSSDSHMDVFDLGDPGKPYSSLSLYSERFNSFQIPIWFRPILRNYDVE